MDDTSKSKRIFIVRHGETDYNRQGMVQGRGIDAPLNAFGLSQAKSFYSHYKHEHFDHVYVSELQRTYQSVEGFINDGLPYTRLAGLDEISWGSQEGVKFSESTLTDYQATVEQWKQGELDVAVGGGESPNQVMQRQKIAIKHILSNHQEKQILICMHGRAIRILVSWLLGHDLSLMDQFPHHNLGLYQLFYTGNMFQIEKVNETNHLQLVKE
ncbi:MAG: histidine phosphatase family protein [Cytophagales bacterium]|nr:histidine phosphatase family protein [Cytophagales bacterium]